MCQSKAEGGRRCAAHALQALQAAARNLRSHPGDPVAVTAHHDAVVQYATTPEGERRLRARVLSMPAGRARDSVQQALDTGVIIRAGHIVAAGPPERARARAVTLLDSRRDEHGESLAARAAAQRTTPAAVLDVIADHPHVSVRAQVARNIGAWQSTLARLRQDPDVGHLADDTLTRLQEAQEDLNELRADSMLDL